MLDSNYLFERIKSMSWNYAKGIWVEYYILKQKEDMNSKFYEDRCYNFVSFR